MPCSGFRGTLLAGDWIGEIEEILEDTARLQSIVATERGRAWQVARKHKMLRLRPLEFTDLVVRRHTSTALDRRSLWYTGGNL